MDREEDFELVRRLCSADPAEVEPAFTALYAKYKDPVYNTAVRILNDQDLAADVMQETFIAILRKAKKFQFQSAFSSWLYRVAVNLCIDARRKRARHRPLSMSEPDVATWAEVEDRGREKQPQPDALARKEELRAEIARAVAALPPVLAATVVLRYVEGLGYEEVARILGVPIGTVKSRLNRAHAALEAELGPRLDDYL